MKDIAGRQVYTTLEETVDPSHTALIVVDVQKDYITGGAMEMEDRDPQGSTYDLSLMTNMLPRLKNLIDNAHQMGTQVVYIKNTALPGHKQNSPSWLYFWNERWGLPEDFDHVLEGTEGHEIADEISPQEGDIVVRKFRPSAFVGTPLELILRSNQIDSIVVTGLATEGCVLATSVVGWYHDFYVTVAEDCVFTTDKVRHKKALDVMGFLFDVIPSEDIINAWQASTGVSPQTGKSKKAIA